jgi:hypothetical protein
MAIASLYKMSPRRGAVRNYFNGSNNSDMPNDSSSLRSSYHFFPPQSTATLHCERATETTFNTRRRRRRRLCAN